MKTQNSFSISFFLKKDKAKVTNGNAPLYARITVNGEPVDLSLKRKVAITAWNQKEQQLDGNTEEDQAAREKIRKTRNDVNAAYDEMRYQKQMVTAEAIKLQVEGGDEEQYTLCKLITYHNEAIGANLEQGRRCSNNTVMKHMERLKKMTNIALNNRWMVNDPFHNFERKIIRKDREALEIEELESFRTIKLDKEKTG